MFARLKTLGLSCATALVLASSPALALKLKIATPSPDGSYWMNTMRAAAADVKTATKGRVNFKFYPGGVMGTDKTVLRKIKIGQLHGAALPGGALAKFYPDSQIYNLPFTYQNFDEIDLLRKTYDQEVLQGFEKGGIKVLGIAEGGFAYIMSKRQAVVSVDDLSGKKVWIPTGDTASIEALKAYQVSPIPLPLADVLPALQTGLVDTVGTSPIGAIALQWHSQIKHVTELPVLYFYAAFAISEKAFKKMNPDDQKIVRTIIAKAFKTLDTQNRKDNIAAFKALQDSGISLHKPNAEQLDKWLTIAEQSRKNFAQAAGINPAKVEEALSLIKKHRAK